jgi:prophage regulatory protein
MVRNLRPRQAADALGIALSTFWKRAKDDPDFPPIINLTKGCSVVREEDLEAYMEKKLQASKRVAVPA